MSDFTPLSPRQRLESLNALNGEISKHHDKSNNLTRGADDLQKISTAHPTAKVIEILTESRYGSMEVARLEFFKVLDEQMPELIRLACARLINASESEKALAEIKTKTLDASFLDLPKKAEVTP